MKCINCGHEIEDDSYFCSDCGQRSSFDKPVNTNAHKSYEQVVEYSKEGLSVPYVILGAIAPFIGLILAIIWGNKYPSRSKSLITGFTISVVLGVIIGFAIVFFNLNNFGR